MNEDRESNLIPLSKNDFRKVIGEDLENDKNRNIISLIITGFERSPKYITDQLGIEPTETRLSGESYDLKFGKTAVTRIAEENLWQYERIETTAEFISDQVELFISEIIKPRSKQLLAISKDANVSFQIIQYYYTGSNPGYFLSKEIINTLAEIGSEVDIDCYCLSSDMD
ncbi:hypothetical protein CH352_18930 [Leptospira hartskeerlii]|uniref:DUF4279 domain-containing protein n=1 Tax=Leptospira hartskeerlii TaxID=2023177 RepID=A0A2M9X851_9LEPT|nr:DUF4279 domain-containing protein [Leptospira hartskeerlii]PJZ23878.1 hypothetical protein CH357_18900 [Leptospira hartskeerlii]PJZ31906.1 hypothetical protein CH352_18930 [Leptospira hartskeerlii]